MPSMRHWQIQYRYYTTKIKYEVNQFVVAAPYKITRRAAWHMARRYFLQIVNQPSHTRAWSFPLKFVTVKETAQPLTPGIPYMGGA